MKLKVGKEKVIPGEAELSCAAWRQDGEWASQVQHPRLKTQFFKKQGSWTFYFPSHPDENFQEGFFGNCERLNRHPLNWHCYFTDNYTYTLGFKLFEN